MADRSGIEFRVPGGRRAGRPPGIVFIHHSGADSTMQTEVRPPWVAVVSLPAGRAPASERKYIGDGRDVLLQGFYWGSHGGAFDGAARCRKSWYRVLREKAGAIRAAGFTWVWFPPP